MLFIKTLQTKIIYLKSLETISYSKCVIKRSHKHNKLTVVLTKIRRKHDRSQRVGDSRWWEFLTVAPAGNKAKRISSANHTTKAIIIITCNCRRKKDCHMDAISVFLNALFTKHLLLTNITMVLVKILSKNVTVVLLEINLMKRTLNWPSTDGNW